MTLSQLDDHAALIVVDLQKGIVGNPGVAPYPAADVVARSADLVGAFRAAGKTVVLVNVMGGAPGRIEGPARGGDRPDDWAELVPELGAEPSDVRITKTTWGAFTNTGLAEALEERGVTQVLVTGIATSIGVESTARSAHELGYHVVLVTDAMTDLTPETHENSVERIFPRLGERTTTAEVLEALGAGGA